MGEEEEPKLKYSRLSPNLQDIISQDAISCLAVSQRFMALGTHTGVVHLMDLIGTPVKEWKAHSGTVNQIAIDDHEEFFASAGSDGNVIVSSLYSNDQTTYPYKRPVLGVQLEPGYAKSTLKQFLYGGLAGTLLLSGRGWFGNSVTTLDQGQGSIFSLAWRKSMVIWANEKGVYVHDLVSSNKIGHIDRDQDMSPDLFRCSIIFCSDSEFMYSWANSVKVVKIQERNQMDLASGLAPKYLEVTHQFKTDFIVSGLAPFEGNIMLLAFMLDLEDVPDVPLEPKPKVKSEPPEIYIVDLDGNEIANDLLSIPGYELFHANDYRLEFLLGESVQENAYYVVSPKDVILAKPRDVIDHVAWLVQNESYAQALEIVESDKTRYTERQREEAILEIGTKYLKALFESKDYVTAALQCPKILKNEKKLWEEWVYKFADQQQMKTIYTSIPTENPVLSHSVYEMVLSEFLNGDLRILLDIVQTWPSAIYSGETMIKAVEMKLKGSATDTLLRTILIELCVRNQQYEKAVFHGMICRLPGQVELISTHNLINFLQKNVLLLLEYERDIAPKPVIAGTDVVDKKQLLRNLKESKGLTLLLQHIDHCPVCSTNPASKSRA
jgi:hypothetical protein